MRFDSKVAGRACPRRAFRQQAARSSYTALGRATRCCSASATMRLYGLCRPFVWRVQVSRRKSLAITAAGMIAVVALVAGCVSSPLTDVHAILSNATTSLANLKSVHFHLEA